MPKGKKLVGLIGTILIIISVFSNISYGAKYVNDVRGQLEGKLDKETYHFEGKFLAHENEGILKIKTNKPKDVEININGEMLNIMSYYNNNSGRFKTIDISSLVVEGENEIIISKKEKSTKAEIVIPYLTLKIGTPEDVDMDPSKIDKIDEIVKSNIENNMIPGAVVLVAKDGVIVKNEAYGVQQKYDMGQLIENQVPMTIETIFDLASVTKVMATTQAIMKLSSEEKIDVNDKVAKYIPQFGVNGKENITIADLLTHTSGLTPWYPTYFYAEKRNDVLKYIENMPLEYETGTKRVYSDFSFMTLGLIVEKVSGENLDKYLDKYIYSNLGMKDTYFNPPKELKYRIAATSWGNPYEYKMVDDPNFGYYVDEDVEDFKMWRNYTLVGEVNDGNAFYANEGIAGHAGLFSTAKDLSILGQTMLNGGGYGTFKVYDKKTINKFVSPQRFGQGYGFELDKSWYMGKYYSDKAFGHTGFTGTQVIFDPQYNLQIIILTNKQNVGQRADGNYKSTGPLSSEICNVVYEAIGLKK